MSTGTGPNLTGDKIASIFNRAGYLARDAFTEGCVAVAWNGADADMFDACLPSNTSATNNGRNFLGIWMNAGTATSGTDRGPLQKLGVAQCLLKTNTACTTGGIAAFAPADAGVVVPYTSAAQVPIGRFTQTKAANASGAVFVGVELDAAIQTQGLIGMIIAPSATLTGTVAGAATETVLSSVTIPAGTLVAGRKLRIKASGLCTAFTASDVTIKVRMNSTTGLQLVTTGALTPAANDLWVIELDVDIRSTTAAIVYGSQIFDAAGTAPLSVAYTTAQTIVASQDNAVSVTATFTVADATAVRNDALSVEFI